MTGRDRMVLMCVCALAVLGAVWVLAVSPERKEAASLDAQVSAANTQLSGAEGQLAGARGAQSRYAAAYAAVVSLGKAVPASDEVPSLIYQLAQASNQKSVDFSSIATSAVAGAAAPGAAAAVTPTTGGFRQMPFTFVFNGSFLDLYHLLQQLNGYTKRTASGELQVSGRLLTIQSTKLAPVVEGTTSKQGPQKLSGTITATAYVLPASQGVAGVASASSPVAGSGAASSSAATASASSSGGSSGGSSPTAPAIVRVGP